MPTQTPEWTVRGLQPWTLLIWLPLCYTLLIGPVVDPVPGPGSVQAWLAAVAAAACFTGAVLSRYRPGERAVLVGRGLLVVLAAVALGCTVHYSAAWSSLFVLLAIGIGVVMIGKAGPAAILAATGLAVIGALSADSDTAGTTAITVLLAGFGTYAINQLFAVVVELQCTRQELARLAVTAERERFARDLHDLLGHTLSLIVVKAEAVRRLAPLDGMAAAGHAADIETVGRQALTDIRHAVSGYRGAGFDRELLSARAALEAAGVELSVQRDQASDSPLPELTDALLGWVVREGATNVVRHARARHCLIRLGQSGDLTSLIIEDDGGGGGQSGRGAGVGLLGLEERVTAVGGVLMIDRSGTGFRIRVDVPSVVPVGV